MTRPRHRHVALAVGCTVAVTVLWHLVPDLSAWVSAESGLVGGPVGLLAGGFGKACEAGQRAAA